MTTPHQENAPQEQNQQQISNKEFNFRALEAKYQRELSQERAEKEQLKRELEQRNSRNDEEDDNEPYVNHQRLKREQTKFGQQLKQETQTEIQHAVGKALAEERRQQWLKNNADFHDVMSHAEKFATQDPELAETILTMPDTFERQKLVYKNIKALGLHKPPEPQKSVQEKIDANRRSPYYQPSGVANAPYTSQSDFSPAGQKQAYEKMQALKSKYGM